MRLSPPVLLLALLAFAACDDIEITDVEPSATDIDLNGFWEGSASGTAVDLSLRHDTLTDEVRGFGALVRTGGSVAFRAEGLVDDERDIITLLLELSTPTITGESGVTLVYYRARPFGVNRIQGSLNGGGFDDATLTLQRTAGGGGVIVTSRAGP
ncbi:MAG: hypothetical protein GWO22_19950 [Actinobacteria bacterium]|nr:hypothetical protein [Actinomycetota bacterium]